MSYLSTQLEAKELAADAVEWLSTIRKSPDRNSLDATAKKTLGKLKSRHACQQIVSHFEAAIAEERLKFTIYDRKASGKDKAAGDHRE